jgi:hypothetical protein
LIYPSVPTSSFGKLHVFSEKVYDKLLALGCKPILHA